MKKSSFRMFLAFDDFCDFILSKDFITECNELECKISEIKAMAKELDD